MIYEQKMKDKTASVGLGPPSRRVVVYFVHLPTALGIAREADAKIAELEAEVERLEARPAGSGGNALRPKLDDCEDALRKATAENKQLRERVENTEGFDAWWGARPDSEVDAMSPTEVARLAYTAGQEYDDENTTMCWEAADAEITKLRKQLTDTEHMAAIVTTERDAAREQVEADGSYKKAIDEALVVTWAGTLSGDAKKDLATLIHSECEIALDPRVSEQAVKLRDTHLSELIALREQVERMGAVIANLPKCWRLNEQGGLVRDVPMVPGMAVFWTGDGFSEKKKAEVQSGTVRGVFVNLKNVDGDTRSSHSLYSTLAAAEAAQAQAEGGGE